ncbi:hypothetical protein EON76_06075 [bacterium]|nr:MAG: hypothetical protein EON76_06075 [bacterium]
MEKRRQACVRQTVHTFRMMCGCISAGAIAAVNTVGIGTLYAESFRGVSGSAWLIVLTIMLILASWKRDVIKLRLGMS